MNGSSETCQSCGMPLQATAEAGTETDGSPGERYCTHCYRGGAFVEPGLTLETYVERSAPMLAAALDMPIERAQEMARAFTATLPRWR